MGIFLRHLAVFLLPHFYSGTLEKTKTRMVREDLHLCRDGNYFEIFL